MTKQYYQTILTILLSDAIKVQREIKMNKEIQILRKCIYLLNAILIKQEFHFWEVEVEVLFPIFPAKQS